MAGRAGSTLQRQTLPTQEVRRLDPSPGLVTHRLARLPYQSPLRYPGAKSRLAPTIGRLVVSARRSPAVGSVIDLFVEPFAGGASVSLRLVTEGIVERVLLADADPLVASFWQVACEDTDWLIDRAMVEHKLFVAKGGDEAVDRWDYWRLWTPSLQMNPQTVRRELAMKCLFLNRTSFSGILHGSAGPIGGRTQDSVDGIGCRWNPDGIAERIGLIGELYRTGRIVDVWCRDWRDTLDTIPEVYPQLIPKRVIAYLDPPYIEKAPKLYRSSFHPQRTHPRASVEALTWSNHRAHFFLAEHLTRRMPFRWILSYDHHPSVLTDPLLYARNWTCPSEDDRLLGAQRWPISKRVVTIRHTAAARARGNAQELLLTTLPASRVPVDDTLRMPDEVYPVQ